MHRLLIATWLLGAGAALACPDCATTRAVRNTLFDERFFGFLSLTLLPLLVLGVIVSLLYRIGEPR